MLLKASAGRLPAQVLRLLRMARKVIPQIAPQQRLAAGERPRLPHYLFDELGNVLDSGRLASAVLRHSRLHLTDQSAVGIGLQRRLDL